MAIDRSISSRPREVVYFFYFPVDTVDNGTIYMFMAQDDYSQKAFSLYTAHEFSVKEVCTAVLNLMLDKDFSTKERLPFVLIIEEELAEFETEISQLISAYNGSVVINQQLLENNTQDLMGYLLERLSQKYGK